MQGKGLALLLLCALALAGCGGGGGEENASGPSATGSTSTSTSQSSTPSTTTPGAELPADVQARLKQARQRAIEEREAEAKSRAAQPPQIEHHDSGGGAAQFKTQGGDNSIVEYGEEASASEREEAAASLHAYLDSLAARRWQAACSYMSLGLIAGLEQLPRLAKKQTGVEGCPEILAALSGPTPDSTLKAGAQADVVSLRVQGERAFVIYRGAGGQALVMAMVKEEGVWRVGSLAGAAAL